VTTLARWMEMKSSSRSSVARSSFTPRASPLTACAALRAALRQLGGGRPVLRCAPAVARLLEGAMKPALQEVSRRLGQELVLQPDEDCAGYEIILA